MAMVMLVELGFNKYVHILCENAPKLVIIGYNVRMTIIGSSIWRDSLAAGVGYGVLFQILSILCIRHWIRMKQNMFWVYLARSSISTDERLRMFCVSSAT